MGSMCCNYARWRKVSINFNSRIWLWSRRKVCLLFIFFKLLFCVLSFFFPFIFLFCLSSLLRFPNFFFSEPTIPANATLVFTMEFVNFEKVWPNLVFLCFSVLFLLALVALVSPFFVIFFCSPFLCFSSHPFQPIDSIPDRIEAANKVKEEGNKLFVAGDHKGAYETYEKAMDFFRHVFPKVIFSSFLLLSCFEVCFVLLSFSVILFFCFFHFYYSYVVDWWPWYWVFWLFLSLLFFHFS